MVALVKMCDFIVCIRVKARASEPTGLRFIDFSILLLLAFRPSNSNNCARFFLSRSGCLHSNQWIVIVSRFAVHINTHPSRHTRSLARSNTLAHKFIIDIHHKYGNAYTTKLDVHDRIRFSNTGWTTRRIRILVEHNPYLNRIGRSRTTHMSQNNQFMMEFYACVPRTIERAHEMMEICDPCRKQAILCQPKCDMTKINFHAQNWANREQRRTHSYYDAREMAGNKRHLRMINVISMWIVGYHDYRTLWLGSLCVEPSRHIPPVRRNQILLSFKN